MKTRSVFQHCILILTIICLYFFLLTPAKACTVFSKSLGENILFGNVENDNPLLKFEIHFNPPNETLGKFGHFFLLGETGNIGGGMNDQGLCFDVAALPFHEANTNKPYGDLMIYLLTKCETIYDAIDFFSGHSWYGHTVNHLMVTDKTGASVIIEHIGNSIYTYTEFGNSQVMTNYSITDTEIRFGDYPCNRFLSATAQLDTAAVTVDNFQKICESVHNAYYNALYASVYNPSTLDIYFFNPNIPGSQRTHFNLIEEMNKGSHYYVLKNNQIISDVPEIRNNTFFVSENAPNPFYDNTSFSLMLSHEAKVNISVINIHGQKVDELQNGKLNPGNYSYSWGKSDLPAGIYFCRLNIAGIIETRKWVKR